MECTPLSWDSAFIQSSPLYRCISSGCESRFDSAMMASIEPDMRVFDIGANVGYYTKKFVEAVGSSGEVHAFEFLLQLPSCMNYRLITPGSAFIPAPSLMLPVKS